jgi:hypothetical protein
MANKLITLRGRNKADNAPLASYQVEMWDIEEPLDIFLGQGIMGSTGETTIEVTETTFNRVFGSSPSLYYKVFSSGVLVSNSREANGPENNPNIEVILINIQDKVEDPNEPPPTDFTVSGAIVQVDGSPATGNLRVRAYDRSPGVTKLLGQVAPALDGSYTITYTSDDLGVPNKETPDLLVSVVNLSAADPNAPLAESPVISNALQQEVVNLVVGQGNYRGPSEYQLLNNKLAAQTASLNLAAIPEKEVTLMAGSNDITPEWVDFYLKARYFSSLTGIAAPIFYGLMRREQPDNLQALLSQERKTLKAELEAAAADNVINPTSIDNIESILDSLEEQIVEQALTETQLPAGEGSLAKVASAVGLSAASTRKFLEAAAAKSDLPASEFWQYIRSNNLLTATEIGKIQLNLKLSAVTLNNMSLSSALQARADIHDARDLAKLSDSDWNTLINNNQAEIPADIAGNTAEERLLNYATLVKKVVADAFPTQVLARQIRVGSEINDTDIDTFFTNNASFEFRTDSVRNYLANNPTALNGIANPTAFRSKLESYQRTFRLTPPEARYDVFQTLYTSNIRSAWDVKRMGKARFVAQFATALGGEDVARETYRRAASVSAKSMLAYSIYASQFNQLPLAVVNADIADETGPAKDALLQIPNLASLFDSQDFCACKECRSVLSPAAFLVDLFEYLKEGSHTDGSTALDKLKLRRPDLTGVLLGCENTNTVLPYIDLVNELLEELVAPTGASHQTTWDAATLRAQPEHLNIAAYTATAGVVYPLSLPFHLWNAEAAAYLNHLGVERFQFTEVLTPQQAATRARNTALVFLGMSSLDLQVFQTTAADAFQLYGLANAGQLTQLQPVETLLERLQLPYTDLVLWLQTRLANPAKKSIVFSNDSCALQEATLTLTNAEYSALNRYVRLARKSGWSPAELDMAVALFSEQDRPNLLVHLSGLLRLQKAFKLKTTEVLAWHGKIDTYVYGEKAGFYQSIFLNPALHNGDATTLAAFALIANGTEVQGTARSLAETPIAAVVAAATALKSDDLQLLVTTLPDAQLRLAHLSHLYRVASFCRANRLSVAEYLIAVATLGGTGLATSAANGTPAAILTFINRIQALKDVRLSWNEQAYLLLHQQPANIPAASDAAMTEELRALQNELRKYSLPVDSDAGTIQLQLRVSLTKLYNESIALEAQAIVDRLSTLSDNDQRAFIDTYFATFANAATLKTQLVGAGALTDTLARTRAVAAPLFTYLSRTTLYQRLSAAFDIAETLTIALLEEYTTHPFDPLQKASAVFLADSFVLSDTDISGQIPAFKTYERLLKAALTITRLRLSNEEAAYLLAHPTTAGWTDIANLPVMPVQQLTGAQAQGWLALLEAVRLQRTVIKPGFLLVDLLDITQDAGITLAILADEVAAATGWDSDNISFLLGSGGYAYALPADFRNAGWLAQLEKAFSILTKTGASAAQAWSLTSVDVTQNQANVVRNIAKARYTTNERWLEVAPDIRDVLRIQQRNALRDYILAADPRFVDTNDLYAFYLMDTEMAPCMLTSRIKLAISSVQLWVQRIQMNLEPGLSFDPAPARQWKWRKNYRVWEANRKVFLFPENWIEPELRDDKSIFFTELENFLQQGEVTPESIETAYLQYLDKLHEVAQLEVVSTYEDEENGEFHVMARTHAVPHKFYYRKWIQAGEWTAWERVDLEIESDHFVLVRHNRRLYLFWATLDLQAEQPTDSELTTTTSSDQTASRTPSLRYSIRMGWSEQRNGQWLSPRVTKEVMESAYPDREKHFLMSTVTNGTLRLDVVYGRRDNSRSTFSARYGTILQPRPTTANTSIEFLDLQGWILNDSTNALEYDGIKSPQQITLDLPIPGNGEIAFTNFREAGNTNRLELPRSGNASNLEKYAQIVLGATPGTFQITMSHQFSSRLVEAPFFYSDGARTYFVTPTESVDDLILEPQPSVTKIEFVRVPKTILTPIYLTRPTPLITTPPRTYLPTTSIVPRGVDNFYQGLNGSTTVRRLSALLAQQTIAPSSFQVALVNPVDRALRLLPTYDDFVNDTIRPIPAPTTETYIDRYVEEKIFEDIRRVITVDVPPKRITIKGQKFRFYSFYHPYTLTFLKQVNKFGAAGLLDPAPDGDAADLRIQQRNRDDFQTRYQPVAKVVDSIYPKENIDFDYSGPYSLYNWELFYHGPLKLATELSKNQRFEEAQTWFHYIFDPTQTDGPAPQRYWRIKPFYEFAGSSKASELLKLLNEGDATIEKQVEQWEKNPFKPHVIARMRVVAYMKATVMKYLDNLIAWGDNLFRLDTIESINEASQIYLLATQILGRRPVQVEKEDAVIRSYDDIENDLDNFSNAWVNLETELTIDDN